MITKAGKQCSFRAVKGHFCSRHRESIVGKKTGIEKLIRAGQVTAAVTAIVKFIGLAAPFIDKVVWPAIQHQHWMRFPHGLFDNEVFYEAMLAKEKSKRGLLSQHLAAIPYKKSHHALFGAYRKDRKAAQVQRMKAMTDGDAHLTWLFAHCVFNVVLSNEI